MTIANAGALPSGPFEFTHRSLQSGLRAWVEAQTGHPLGYVEQLYTFADRGRTGDADRRTAISISYLGLTREDQVGAGEAHWSGWYDYFPWEDHRAGPPALLAKLLTPRLRAWAKSAPSVPRSGNAGSAPRSPSASTTANGTRNWCCSATSCSTRPR